MIVGPERRGVELQVPRAPVLPPAAASGAPQLAASDRVSLTPTGAYPAAAPSQTTTAPPAAAPPSLLAQAQQVAVAATQPLVAPTVPLRMAVMGDSLCAGTQDGNTLESRQHMVFAEQLARAAGFEYNAGYIGGQGVPFPIFQRDGFDQRAFNTAKERLTHAVAPLALYTYYIAPLPFLPPVWSLLGLGTRTDESKNSSERPQTNFAVPSYELRHLTECRGVGDYMQEMHRGGESVTGLAAIVPWTRELLQNGSSFSKGTQLEQVIKTHPDLVVVWAGSNDCLGPIMSGNVDDRTVTPMEDKLWQVRETSLITDRQFDRTMHEVMPGIRTSVKKLVDGLLAGTKAEIVMLNVPDTSNVPLLRTLGEPIGPLPFRVRLANGIDVTEALEHWVVPLQKADGGTFPVGSKVDMLKVLDKFLSLGTRAALESDPARSREQFSASIDEVARGGMFTDDEVVDPTEQQAMRERADQINQLLAEAAAANPRIHLVDIHGLLDDARVHGRALRGTGDAVTVMGGFTGSRDAEGRDGMFSFDGLHPSDTGHAMIANAVLDTMKQELSGDPRFASLAQVQPVDERAVYRQDPHRTGSPSSLTLDKAHLEALHRNLQA